MNSHAPEHQEGMAVIDETRRTTVAAPPLRAPGRGRSR